MHHTLLADLKQKGLKVQLLNGFQLRKNRLASQTLVKDYLAVSAFHSNASFATKELTVFTHSTPTAAILPKRSHWNIECEASRWNSRLTAYDDFVLLLHLVIKLGLWHNLTGIAEFQTTFQCCFQCTCDRKRIFFPAAADSEIYAS